VGMQPGNAILRNGVSQLVRRSGESVVPGYSSFPSRLADVIFPDGGHNEVGIDLVIPKNTIIGSDRFLEHLSIT
jgi:hypothetical protein